MGGPGNAGSVVAALVLALSRRPARRHSLTCCSCGAIFSSCTSIWAGSGSDSAPASAPARSPPPCQGLEAQSAPPCHGPVGVPSAEQVVARRMNSEAHEFAISSAAGFTAPSPSLSSSAAAIRRGRRRREPGAMGASSGSASSSEAIIRRQALPRAVPSRARSGGTPADDGVKMRRLLCLHHASTHGRAAPRSV